MTNYNIFGDNSGPFVLNTLMHCWVVLTALLVMFFQVESVSKQTTFDDLNDEIVHRSVPIILNKYRLNKTNSNWNEFNKELGFVYSPAAANPEPTDNNTVRTLFIVIYVIETLFTIVMLMYLSKVPKLDGKFIDFSVGSMIGENLLFGGIVGALLYLLFQYVNDSFSFILPQEAATDFMTGLSS